MIHTCSVLQGYQASLGMFTLRIAFMIGILFVLPIPEDKLEAIDIVSSGSLYALQMAVHFLCALNMIVRLN